MGIGYQKEIDNNPQSQISPPFRYFMTRHLNEDVVLSSPIEKDDTEIELVSGHGFTGASHEVFILWYGDRYIQSKVADVTDDVITIADPAAFAVPVSGPTIIRGSINIAVDGSSSPIIFEFDMNGASTPIDISTAIIKFYSGATTPDDGTLGGATELEDLTEGCLLRRYGDVLTYNFGNYCKNGDFRDSGANIEYISKAPAGTNGTIITWDLKNIFTNEIRFDPRRNDKLTFTVRGDIATNNDCIHFMLLGSYTKGE